MPTLPITIQITGTGINLFQRVGQGIAQVRRQAAAAAAQAAKYTFAPGARMGKGAYRGPTGQFVKTPQPTIKNYAAVLQKNAAATIKAATANINLGRSFAKLTQPLKQIPPVLKRAGSAIKKWITSNKGASRAQKRLATQTKKTRTELREQWWQIRKNYMNYRPWASAMTGVTVAISALRGNLYQMVRQIAYAGRLILPLIAIFAALTIAIGGTAMALKKFGASIENLRRRMTGLVGVQGDVNRALEATRARAIKYGRSIAGITDAQQVLMDQGLALPSIWEAAMDMAAARGITGAEAANLIAAAVGMETENLKSLAAVGVKTNKALEGSTNRYAVAMEAVRAITVKYGGAASEYARSTAGAWQRIKTALTSVVSILVHPIWDKFFRPIIVGISQFLAKLIGVAKAVWKSKDVIDAWADTLKYARDVLEQNREELNLLKRFITMVFIGAVKAMIWIVRLLIFAVDAAATAWRSLSHWFRITAKQMKPLFDMLRLLAAYIKSLDWRAVLAETKKWAVAWPSFIFTAISAALALLAGGLPGLAVLILNWLGDLIISMLPFRQKVKDALHRIWDIAIIGAAIGAFFGWTGMFIGLGVGALVGVLDEKYKLGIYDWLVKNLPEIFPYILVGGVIGKFFGAQGAIIGVGTGLVIWALNEYKVEILGWLVKFTDDLAWQIAGVRAKLLTLGDPTKFKESMLRFYNDLRESMVTPIAKLELEAIAAINTAKTNESKSWDERIAEWDKRLGAFLGVAPGKLPTIEALTIPDIKPPSKASQTSLDTAYQDIYNTVIGGIPTPAVTAPLSTASVDGISTGMDLAMPRLNTTTTGITNSIMELLYDPLLALDWMAVWVRISDDLQQWFIDHKSDLEKVGKEIGEAIRRKLGNLTFRPKVIWPDTGGGGGGGGTATAQFGKSGIATKPTLFLAGERGAEAYAFTPIGRRGQGGLGGGGTSIVTHIHSPVVYGRGGAEELADLVGERIMKKMSRSYSIAMVR